jgi:hypothetical protein
MSSIRLDENGVMLRPTRTDKCVRRRAAEMALSDVKDWIGDPCCSDAEIIEILAEYIDLPDGFGIVKSPEDDGWCGNAKLGMILNCDFIGQAENELVQQWVKCLGVTLHLPIGAKCQYHGKVAKVVAWDEDLAQYKLHNEDLKAGVRALAANAEDVVEARDSEEVTA